jgi:hypothetical protein
MCGAALVLGLAVLILYYREPQNDYDIESGELIRSMKIRHPAEVAPKAKTKAQDNGI